MDTTSLKSCTHCHQAKGADDFRNTTLSPTGKANICKTCAKKRREDKKQAAPAAPSPTAEEESAIDSAAASFKVEAGLGFTAQLQGADLVIEQPNGDGSQTIWLSRHEATDLMRFITENMARWEKVCDVVPPQSETEGQK